MLDPNGRFFFSALPEIFIYPDNAVREGFYAIPVAPRIALDEEGHSNIGLVIYGSKRQDQFKTNGGYFSLTTSLALYPGELEQLKLLLAQRLLEQYPPTEDQEPLVPMLYTPSWSDSKAFLKLGPDNIQTGIPSMMGENQCAFSISLDGNAAEQLLQAWNNNLEGLSICYQVTIQSIPVSYTGFLMDASQLHVSVNGITAGTSIEDTAMHTLVNQNLELELDGDLVLPGEGLEKNLKVVAL